MIMIWCRKGHAASEKIAAFAWLVHSWWSNSIWFKSSCATFLCAIFWWVTICWRMDCVRWSTLFDCWGSASVGFLLLCWIVDEGRWGCMPCLFLTQNRHTLLCFWGQVFFFEGWPSRSCWYSSSFCPLCLQSSECQAIAARQDCFWPFASLLEKCRVANF